MKTTILMVDDEPDAEVLFRQNFRREIRKNEYTFLFAQSGSDALDVLASDDAAGLIVILSDINMPGMSGLELLDVVKRRQPDLPVIMISAYGDAGTENDARNRGAKELIPKPVDFDKLKLALSTLPLEAA